MNRFLIGALVLLAGALACISPSQAQTNACSGGGVQGMLVGGAAGSCAYLAINPDGSINTTSGGSGTGNVNVTQQAGNTNATGNGVTTTGTQRVTISSDSTGQIATTGAGVASGADGVSNTATGQQNYNRASLFNGTTWDRQVGCTQTAPISATAGASTQLIALSGTTSIRVCSFSLALSAAGQAQFTQGTGTNCGTGSSSLTGAVALATGTPWTVAAGSGYVLRSAAGNALCIFAATGNAGGFITYAQY